ncbi:beta-lactamase family protein [Asticcacaulis biprosthecium C19]|uniref:Beta-lactamase family protein n=1 Tax=Asticcacaulis biprosthecium C19 TaxID=715226 RepID=F4QL20_9CAUL|nr:serine hydrolase domain-containing protein [Asticcacaulis biprosthecium]EGF92243.1 beta-lactamase family protein [Asticcacaulis biprosthecium C19]
MAQSRRMNIQGLLAGAALALGLGTSARAQATPFEGTWTGRLTAGSMSLRLRLVVTGSIVKLISLDQGSGEIPASKVKIEGSRISLEFKAIKADYKGELKDADHITGTFTQGAPMPLDFNRGEVIEESSAGVEALTVERLQAIRSGAGTPAIGAAWQGKSSGRLADGSRMAGGANAVTPDDQWHWGSITKSMTSTLVARLVESGAVRWDTTVGALLGDKAGVYKDANFLHLLSHRAGLQPNIPDSRFNAYARDGLADARVERLAYAAEALSGSPVGPLAGQTAYSNNGYVVAGAMIEVATGQSWEALIQDQLFKPLGITSAGFGAPGTAGKVDQPLGHLAQGASRMPAPVGPGLLNDNPMALGPAGRVHMSMADMLVYLAAHRDRTDLLTPASWAKLHTPPFGGDYALGWVVRPDGAIWHNGSNTVWYGEVLVDAAAGVVCTACGNDAAPQTMAAVGQALMAARAAALV